MQLLEMSIDAEIIDDLSVEDAENLLFNLEEALNTLVRHLTGCSRSLWLGITVDRRKIQLGLQLQVNEHLAFTQEELLAIFLQAMAWGPDVLCNVTLNFIWQDDPLPPHLNLRVAHLDVAMGFAVRLSPTLVEHFAQQIVRDHLDLLGVQHHCYKTLILVHPDEIEAHVFAHLHQDVMLLTEGQDVELGEKALERDLLEHALKIDRTAEVAVNIRSYNNW